MITLLREGDADILRDATSSSNVFWYRAREGWQRVLLIGFVTLVLVAMIVGLILGPEGTGQAWATRERLALGVSLLGILWVVGVGWLFFKFMPGRNDRVVLTLRSMVRTQIDPLDERMRALSDEQLRARTDEFKQRLAAGATIDEIRPEAYAVVREASRRARNHRQFECQLIGGRVIEGGNVAEMRTGEGKTIVCYVANYLKFLQGQKVHMVTVNDYLVQRDANFCKPIFELLGVSVGYITAAMDSYGPGVEVRRAAYDCDITYGTNSEFGFDYLRDNMKHTTRDQVQGRLDFVVVDEVDSILIDEARTPLIISGPAHDDVSNYRTADAIAQTLIRKQEASIRDMRQRIDELEANPPKHLAADPKFRDGIKKFRSDPLWLSSDEAEAIGLVQYFVVELDRKSVHMTEHGAKAAQAELGLGSFYDSKNMNWPHYIDNALRAHLAYQKDKEYVVQNDTVIIVDEFTGRLMHGRQWSDGLHQAVEAKERVTIKQETQTLATITLQNFFKLYRQLAGMTGTAMTESDEFMKIYKLEVIAIPTNKPVRRVDFNDKIYKTEENKFDAIVEEIRSYSHKGYPADPWSLYDELRQARRRLKQHSAHPDAPPDSAELIAAIDEGISTWNEGKGDAGKLEAAYVRLLGGRRGGRPLLVGTVSVEKSEKLSQLLTRRYGIEHEVLNAKNHAREAEIVAKAGQQHLSPRAKDKEMWGNVTIATNMAGRGTDIVLGPGVAALGGLHVLGTERHESRRIDNQLRGRCGRQGDPGSSRFFLALSDDLLRLFMGEWVLKMLELLGFEEGMAIEDKRLTRGIERAQRKVEERNFGIRKNLLEYDEVMDYQRRTFYRMRQKVVEGRELSEMIWEMIDDAVADAVERFYEPRYAATCVAEWVAQHLGAQIDADKLDVRDFKDLCEEVRELAAAEVKTSIERTFGEYVDPDSERDDWDIRGLINWASHYGLTLTQREVKEGEPDDIRDRIVKAAIEKIGAEDLKPLEQYCDPLYAKARLVRWAQEKFGVAIPLEELRTAQKDDAERIIGEKMREAYRRREAEYPVGAVIDWAIQRGGSNVIETCTRIAQWANRKFGLNWTYEHLNGKSPKEVFEELAAINHRELHALRNGAAGDGLLNAEIEKAIAAHPGDQIREWARQRFGAAMETAPLDLDGDVRGQLRRYAYEMARYELTRLEQMVLLTTFDAVWKDHMYSMDLLRSGIGLRGYAERDPKIEYKREGTRLFNEMLSNIRERVTDLVFKVQVTLGPPSGETDAGGAPAPLGPTRPSPQMTTQKADATNVGFAAAARETAQEQKSAAEGASAAGPAEPIRRAMPKVGRNDPCPCGSGKKYKQCHGKMS